MNAFIFLTLLCLGMASAAPKVDHGLDAQSDVWMVNMVEDTVNNAALEKSPEALEKDNQDQSKEEQGVQTAVNASDNVILQMKISRRIFDMFRDLTQRSMSKKVVKGVGKKIVGGLLRPENVGDIVYEIGKQIVLGKKTEEGLAAPDLVTETVEEF